MKTWIPKDFDEYISQFPQNVQNKLQKLRSEINTAAPYSTEAISYQMPTFRLNGNLVHFAAYKNHIGFYPTPSVIINFSSQLTGYITSKGAIQFPIGKPIPLLLISKMVKFRVQQQLKKPAKKSAN